MVILAKLFPIGQELRLSLFDGGRPAAGDNASRRIDVNRDGPKPAVLGAAVPVLIEPPHVAAIFDNDVIEPISVSWG